MAASMPPRFLLPALSPMWRSPRAANALRTAPRAIRHASTSKGKPIVLEKPAKFNPPSHGTRLPRKQPPKHYGGSMSEGEKFAQSRREYPGLAPPVGSKAHRFINSRAMHLAITLGTLTILAISTFVLNFTQTSPFKHLLPPASEFWSNPFKFIGTWIRVLQLHELDRNEKVIKAHTEHTEDVAKRAYFRKVHGLDKENPIRNLLGGGEEDEVHPEHATATRAASGEGVGSSVPVAVEAAPETQETKKKRFGIF